MRRIVTAISAAALAFSMVSLAMPANAAAGFDSAYAGESAFLTLNPGQSGTFTVFFANTGTNSWTKGTSTQVDLAACLEDKVTCNQQDASEAPFNPGGATGWLSSTRYASTTQTAVAPGAIGTFTYNVMVPNTATGLHRFNGATVVSSTGADVHNEGYYQDVNIPGQQATCTPATITTTPHTAQETVGATHTQSATVLCSDGKASGNAAVTFAIQAPVGSLNPNLTLTGVTDSTGKVSVTWTRANPDTDTVDVFPTAQPNIRDTATIFWVVKPVISCTPTTSATAVNGTNRIFTIALTDPQTGAAVTSATNISVGVATDVTKGQATISSGTITRYVDTSTNSSNNAGKQILIAITDANGNATLTLAGNNATVTAIVWLEQNTPFGGDNEGNPGTNTVDDNSSVPTGIVASQGGLPAGTATPGPAKTTNVLDSNEFQATCGTTTFQAVQAVTLAVSPSTAATVAQSAQRIFTVSATDSAGNPTSAKINIGFVENLLATTGTSARITWFDIDAAAADQRGSQSSSSSSARQSTCNRVSGGTWFANSGTVVTADTAGNALVRDLTAATKRDFDTGTSTSGNYGSKATFVTSYPKVAGNITIPAIGRATFSVCSEVANDVGTPLVWQDLNATPDFTPETGEPQAQGGATTWATPALTTGTVFSEISAGNTDVLPATGSADDTVTSANANSQMGLGLEQITFRMRNQSRNGFFPVKDASQTAGSCTGDPLTFGGSTAPNSITPCTGSTGQTVIWTVQNTGSSNVFIVNFDGSATATATTVPPGQAIQVQSPILASGDDCIPGGRDDGGVNIWSLGGRGEYSVASGADTRQKDCFDSANIMVNAGNATGAIVTGTLVSNGAISTSATITWINALAEPTEPAGVAFTVSGTVTSVNTFGYSGDVTAPTCSGTTQGVVGTFCYYLLQTSAGTTYKINFGGSADLATGRVHSSETYIYLGAQLATKPQCDGYTPCSPGGNDLPLGQVVNLLSTGNKLTYTNNPSPTGAFAASPTTGNAVHNITATQ